MFLPLLARLCLMTLACTGVYLIFTLIDLGPHDDLTALHDELVAQRRNLGPAAAAAQQWVLSWLQERTWLSTLAGLLDCRMALLLTLLRALVPLICCAGKLGALALSAWLLSRHWRDRQAARHRTPAVADLSCRLLLLLLIPAYAALLLQRYGAYPTLELATICALIVLFVCRMTFRMGFRIV